MKTTLEAVTSYYLVDFEKFQTYADETVKLNGQLDNWYPMTPTMHKIQIHGSTVIKQAIIPIGQLSEEQKPETNILGGKGKTSRENLIEKCATEMC